MAEFKDFDSKTVTILNSILAVVSDLQDKSVKLERDSTRISTLEEKLDFISKRLDAIEQHCHITCRRYGVIEHNAEQMGTVLHKVIDRCKENSTNIKNIEEKSKEVEDIVDELHWRSMANNLVVSGLKLEANEDTERVIKHLFENKLSIEKEINFVSVHRFGKKNRNGGTPILIKFISKKDKDLVLKRCYRLKGSNISIREQFPSKIEKKRKQLYPALKKAKREKRKVVMVRDNLFIDGERYDHTREEKESDTSTSYEQSGTRTESTTSFSSVSDSPTSIAPSMISNEYINRTASLQSPKPRLQPDNFHTNGQHFIKLNHRLH